MSRVAARSFAPLLKSPLAAPPLRRLLDVPPAASARGTVKPGRPHIKRCVITLPAVTFDRISMLAAASRVSFAEAIRQLVERGFDATAEPR